VPKQGFYKRTHLKNTPNMREITLSDYNPQWPQLFSQEAELLKEIFGDLAINIYHKGRTSVPNLMAKPIIDITIEVEDISKVNQLNKSLAAVGYSALGEYGMPLRRLFAKGDPHTHHLHVWDKGHDEIAKDLLFRETLIQNVVARIAYENLKQKLCDQHRFEPDQYTMGKDRLIKEILRAENYNGLSMVFVLHESEKQAYKNFMNEDFVQNKSLVLSQGVNFIGAISLNENGAVDRKVIRCANEQAEKLIARWLETREN
jgi:GrpB-like predicted nucleotidyltransferase (UPF0157 family)